MGPGGALYGQRYRTSGVAGVPAPRRHRQLERRRRIVGVSAARLTIRARRYFARGPGDAQSHRGALDRGAYQAESGTNFRITAAPTIPATIMPMPTASGSTSETH